MPELPEVETVRVGLSQLLPGKVISGVTNDWVKSYPNAQTDTDAYVIGAKVTNVRRRAKVLIIDLSSEYSLVIHLKMTGQMVYRGAGVAFGAGHPSDSLIGKLPDKSTRVIFCLQGEKGDPLESNARKQRSAEQGVHEVQLASTGDGDTAVVQERWQSFGLGPKVGQCVGHLFFNDQRKFGWVKLFPTPEIPNIDFFKKVGPEPLSAEFTHKDLKLRLLKRPNTNIKAALLDQTVIAGVGNIYADESLWGAKIHPTTLVRNLSAAKINKLYEELRYVLNLAIEKGGSSDRNYVNAEGKKGSYLSFARVFRREGQPCPHCGSAIIKTRVAGRGTHTCPKCQKS